MFSAVNVWRDVTTPDPSLTPKALDRVIDAHMSEHTTTSDRRLHVSASHN